MPRPASEFVDLPLVQEHMRKAAHDVAAAIEQQSLILIDDLLRIGGFFLHFDSPLEVLFYTWWIAASRLFSDDRSDLRIESQREVTVDGQNFRLDFLILPDNPSIASSPHWIPMAVEVDGHSFHERTREQVTSRDHRDRCLQRAGWKVFHFSYSEFTENPFECVLEVMTMAEKNYRAVTIQNLLRGEEEKADATR